MPLVPQRNTITIFSSPITVRPTTVSNQSLTTGDHMITRDTGARVDEPLGPLGQNMGIGSQRIENGQWEMSRAQGPMCI